MFKRFRYKPKNLGCSTNISCLASKIIYVRNQAIKSKCKIIPISDSKRSSLQLYFAISSFARIENKALELSTQLRYDKQTCPFSHKSLVIQKGYIKSLIKVPLGTFIIKVFLNLAQYIYKFSAIVVRHFATAQQSNWSNLVKEDFF